MTNDDKLSANMEEYLEVLYNLSQCKEIISTNQISEKLEIAPGSVTPMLKKLAGLGYITYTPYKGAQLTDKGVRKAKSMTRKHRLLECFLHDILKIKRENVHDQACEMEHTISDDAERALCQLLENPSECPDEQLIPECDFSFQTCDECKNHDQDIDEVGKRKENLVPLVRLNENQTGKISFIRGDNNIIKRLMELGITINENIKVINIAPLKGPIELDVKGSKLILSRDIVNNIFVELETN